MYRASWYLSNETVLRYIRVALITLSICICKHATLTDGKVFERCELAKALRYGHGVDVNEVANWVCIAQHSSSLNTSAFGGNAKSGSHGLFQISDEYWCSPPGKGVACGVKCDRLRDDDISDDFACVKKIHEEHQRLSGDGFNAWIAYQTFCKDNSYEYIEDCFGKEEQAYLHSKSITANYVQSDDEENYDPRSRGKVYGRCELAKELFLKHKMPMDEIPTWVCIAQHESNYDTSVVGRLNADGSGDHGLFQISDLFWCSQKGGRKKACGLPCSKFLDSDITDDVKCVKQIHKEHTQISGDGFNAWSVYKPYCKNSSSKYIRGCFDGIDTEDSKSSNEQKTKPLEKYQAYDKPSKGNTEKPHGKVYQPCELAEELRNKYHMPEDQIATWVCIAKHESGYNTSAIGYGDHGLFQISDIYWCSPPGKGWACGLSCADLEDSDISDDVKCIQKIYEEHSRLSGDGFSAWTVYPRYCSNGRSDKYISQCSSSDERLPAASSYHSYSKPLSSNSVEDYRPAKGKIYGRCELANELLTKYHMPMEEIPTWVCIANHESSYDTSAVGRLNADGSADHGLFQISDLYWCSDDDDHGKACGLPCSKLLDSDISDDVECIKQIHEEHTRISGDGFNAWTVYNAYCKDRTEEYTRGCFDGSASIEEYKSVQKTTERSFMAKNKPKGKVYEDCELATELRDKHHIPNDQIPSWVCIAKHQSGLNTAASVAGSHGMFFISDEFWCSPPGKGKACDLHCSDLEDSDISDDVECVRMIYDEHQRLFGNGFNAWNVFNQHCSNGRANDYTNHCTGFKSTLTNAIAYGTQQNQYKYGGKTLDSNKPVSNHIFSANPFLKFHEPLNSNALLQKYSDSAAESFSASEDVGKVVSVKSDYSNNPFLKRVQPALVKPSVQPSKSTPSASTWSISSTPAPTISNPFLKSATKTPATSKAPNPFLQQFSQLAPQQPTAAGAKAFAWSMPASANSLQSYQPMNEEKAKNVAFKAFATPSPSVLTVTPRANRLQPYNLKTSPVPLWLTSTTTKPTNRFEFGQWTTQKGATETTIPFWFTTKKPTSTTFLTTPFWLASSTQKPAPTTGSTTQSWSTSKTQKSTGWAQFGQWSTQKSDTPLPTKASWQTSTTKNPTTKAPASIPLWQYSTTLKPASTSSTSTTKKPAVFVSSTTPFWLTTTTQKPSTTSSTSSWHTSTTQKFPSWGQVGQWSTPKSNTATTTKPTWQTSTTKKSTSAPTSIPFRQSSTTLKPASTSSTSTTKKPASLASSSTPFWATSTTTSSTTPSWRTSTTQKPPSWAQFGQWSTKKSNTEPPTKPSWQISTKRKSSSVSISSSSTTKKPASSTTPFWLTSTTPKPSSTTSTTTPTLRTSTTQKLSNWAQFGQWSTQKSNSEPPTKPSWQTTTTKNSTSASTSSSSTTKKPASSTTPFWVTSTTPKPSSTTSTTILSRRTSTTQKLPNWAQFGQWSTQKSNSEPPTKPSWQTTTTKKFTSSSTSSSSTTKKPASSTTPFWLTSTTPKPSSTTSTTIPSWRTSTTQKLPNSAQFGKWSTQKNNTAPPSIPSWQTSTTKKPSTVSTSNSTNQSQQYKLENPTSTLPKKSLISSKVTPLASPTSATAQLKEPTTKNPSKTKDSWQYNSGQYSSGKHESKSAKLTLIQVPQAKVYNNFVYSTSTTKTSTNGGLSAWKTTTSKTLTTKSPSKSYNVSATTSSSTKFEPSRPFPPTTLRPSSTRATPKKVESPKLANPGAYVPYKPPSIVKNTGQYTSSKSSNTTVEILKFNSGLNVWATSSTTKPTTKPTSSAKSPYQTITTSVQLNTTKSLSYTGSTKASNTGNSTVKPSSIWWSPPIRKQKV